MTDKQMVRRLRAALVPFVKSAEGYAANAERRRAAGHKFGRFWNPVVVESHWRKAAEVLAAVDAELCKRAAYDAATEEPPPCASTPT